MAKKLAEAFVVVKVDNKLAAGLASIRKQTTLAIGGMSRRIGTLMGGIFKGVLRNIKRAILAVTAAIGAIGIASVKMAANVHESENLFEVSMGKMAGAAREFSESVSNSLGLFAPDVRKMIGTFNVMLKSIGLTEQEAYRMSTSFSLLAQDMASFFNLNPDVAFQKLQAGITGEAEPLKRLGILVNENTVKMYAFEKGIGNITKESGKLKGVLSETEKVMARYGLIMDSTKDAQGDLERTGDSLTNRFRTFGNTVKKLMVDIGSLFTEDLAADFGTLTNVIQTNSDKIVQWVDKVRLSIKQWIVDQGGMPGLWDKIKNAASKVRDVFLSIVDAIKNIWTKGKEIFDKLPKGFKDVRRVAKSLAVAIASIFAVNILMGIAKLIGMFGNLAKTIKGVGLATATMGGGAIGKIKGLGKALSNAAGIGGRVGTGLLTKGGAAALGAGAGAALAVGHAANVTIGDALRAKGAAGKAGLGAEHLEGAGFLDRIGITGRLKNVEKMNATVSQRFQTMQEAKATPTDDAILRELQTQTRMIKQQNTGI